MPENGGNNSGLPDPFDHRPALRQSSASTSSAIRKERAEAVAKDASALGRPAPAPELGGLAPIGAEKSALTGSERSFQGLWAAAFSFPRIRQFVTHLPGSVSPEPRLQVNLARRSARRRRGAPEAACRSSISYVTVGVRRSWHSRIWPTPASSRRKAGEGAGDAGIVERKVTLLICSPFGIHYQQTRRGGAQNGQDRNDPGPR